MSFDKYQELIVNSFTKSDLLNLFKHATEYYKKSSRGTLLLMYTSLSDMRKKITKSHDFMYVPLDLLRSLENSDVIINVENYNPKDSFVICIVCDRDSKNCDVCSVVVKITEGSGPVIKHHTGLITDF